MTLKRIKELRKILKAEVISYGELAEIDKAGEEANINISDMMADEILDALEAIL